MFHLLIPTHQFWVLVIGSLVPAITYVLNKYAPWVSEPVKAVVHAVVAAVAAGLYTALETNVFGLNASTAQYVVSAIVAAFVAHHLFWKPSLIASILGAGQNANGPKTNASPQASA